MAEGRWTPRSGKEFLDAFTEARTLLEGLELSPDGSVHDADRDWKENIFVAYDDRPREHLAQQQETMGEMCKNIKSVYVPLTQLTAYQKRRASG